MSRGMGFGCRLLASARSKFSTQCLFSDGCRPRVAAPLSLVDSVLSVHVTVEVVGTL